MKQKKIYFLIILLALPLTVKAQYETMMLNQWIQNMNANEAIREQYYIQELSKAINAEKERQKEQQSATCWLLPCGNDTFYAYITLLYLNADDIYIFEEDTSTGIVSHLPISSFTNISGKLISSAKFHPGTTVSVYHGTTNERLAYMTIPESDSNEYQEFVCNTRILANSLGSMNSTTYSTGHSSSSTRSVTSSSTCSLCGGKGWIEGSKNVTYGSSSKYWCEECDKMVNPSHSHDQCPSCGGKGNIVK